MKQNLKVLFICVSIFCFIDVLSARASEKPGSSHTESEIVKRQLDQGLFISPRDLRKRMKDGLETVLIDVRNSEAFDSYRIPGSINLPLYAVKTKSVLKAKYCVLFNDGYSNHSLIKACNNLKGLGFQTVILYGGLTAWYRDTGKIEGDYFEQIKMNKVPPRAMFVERGYDNWMVVNISVNKDQVLEGLFPSIYHIPYSENQDAFNGKIRKLLAGQYKGRFLSLLLYNEDGNRYDHIEKELTGVQNLFFLKGGAEGYERFLTEKALISNRGTRKVSTTRECTTCR